MTETIDLKRATSEPVRSLQMPDGLTYLVRSVQDLPVGDFQRMLAEEEGFGNLALPARDEIEKRHLQLLLTLPLPLRCATKKGSLTMTIAMDSVGGGIADVDLLPGDHVHVAGAPYEMHNIVKEISADGLTVTITSPWPFEATDVNVARSIRFETLELLSYRQFAAVVSEAKRVVFDEEVRDAHGADESPAESGEESK